MSEQPPKPNQAPPAKSEFPKPGVARPDPKLNQSASQTPPDEGGSAPLQKLTKEEQLALYEKSLKEDDWGHQPC